jgi:hypothetical protein
MKVWWYSSLMAYSTVIKNAQRYGRFAPDVTRSARYANTAYARKWLPFLINVSQNPKEGMPDLG